MIEVKNLSFSYVKERPFMTGLHLSISPGEIYGLLGPSGAGKSTLQKILTGMLRHYQGSVTLLGVEVSKMTSDDYKKIGVAFEFPNFYLKYTAFENLTYFGSLYDVNQKTIEDYLREVGLYNDKDKRVSDYSKGMKMRLNFIRSLLHAPKVLFLDEPTSGLDPFNAKIMKNMILDFKKKGGTVILTTHNMHDVEELCDRFSFIDQGKILKTGTLSDFIPKSNQNPLSYVISKNNQEHTIATTIDALDETFLHAILNKEVISMHSHEITLNDVFIALTGKDLHAHENTT